MGQGSMGLAMGPAGLTPHQAIFCLPSSSSHRHGNPSARAAPLQLRFPPHGGFGGLFPPLLQPLLTLIFLSVPTSAHIPRGSQLRAGIYRGAPQPPHAAGLGGTFPGPPNSIKGRGQWMEHPWSSGGGGHSSYLQPQGLQAPPHHKGDTQSIWAAPMGAVLQASA